MANHASFMPKYGNFENQPLSSKTTAHRATICPISTSWDRTRVYVQVLEVWPKAKLVVKQSAKAHVPLIFLCDHFQLSYGRFLSKNIAQKYILRGQTQ